MDFNELRRIIDRSIDEVSENDIKVDIHISKDCACFHYEPWIPKTSK
jgi:hypothetical protein